MCLSLLLYLDSDNDLLLTPDGGVWKTLKINGKKWLLANTTSKVQKFDKAEPSTFVVFNNETVVRNMSLFTPRQIPESPDEESDYDDEDAATEELIVRDILRNLDLLKEQEKLALLGPENDIGMHRLDDSVKVILVDKIKDKDMMQKIEGLEEGEMVLLDHEYGSHNEKISNVHARHQKLETNNSMDKTKSYDVVVRRKPRRRQRVKLQRGYGNKVQKVYITY